MRIGRHENVEAFVFGYSEQLAVLERRPPSLVSCGDFMLRQGLAQRYRGALVEKDAHSGRSQGAPCCVFEHRAYLVEGDPGEQLDKLGHRDTILEIFEQRRDGHAGAAEQPEPLTRSGSRSTAEQVDQSIILRMLAPSRGDG